MLGSCKKRPTLDPAPSKIEGISANWELTRVDQIDVFNKLVYVESDSLLNITKSFIGSKTPMQINITGGGAYTITAGVAATMFKKTSGTWAFNNNEAPERLILDRGTADEMAYKIMKPIRPQDQFLVLKYNKICQGKRVVSYHLWYKRK